MAVATQDRQAQWKQGVDVEFPVIAADIIYSGTMVGTSLGNATTGGYVKPAADAEFEVFMGIAQQQANNASGAAGAVDCIVRQTGTYILNFQGTPVQGDVGREVYVVDDSTVGFGATTAYFQIACGRIVEYIDTSTVRVKIDGYAGKSTYGQVYTYGVVECATIVRGDIVVDTDTGYAGQSADTDKFFPLGIAIEAVDNSTGASGALTVDVVKRGIVLLDSTQAITAYRIGGTLFADGAQAVDTAAGTAQTEGFIGTVNALKTTKLVYVTLQIGGQNA